MSDNSWADPIDQERHLVVYYIQAVERKPGLPEGAPYLYTSMHVLMTSKFTPIEWFAMMAAYSEAVAEDIIASGASMEYLHWKITYPLNQFETISRLMFGGL